MLIYDFIGHLVSTKSAEELHIFAERLGLKREWYQTPSVSKNTGKVAQMGPEYSAHYDLTTAHMRSKARRMGAVEVDPLSLVKRAWWYKKQFQLVSQPFIKQDSKWGHLKRYWPSP